ncbi:MAG: magnesium/cobalt transporter CorA [Neisseriaceae bacterium]|nr:magnesium/cobalt transporter CorA [Neisseriaceae bacterium]
MGKTQAKAQHLAQHEVALPVRQGTRAVPSSLIRRTVYDQSHVTVTEYTADEFLAQVVPDQVPGQTQWVHFIGVKSAVQLNQMLAPFKIHPLVVEDILTRQQRPKIEEYDDYLFFAGRVFEYDGSRLVGDQVYLIVGEGFVLTFQNRPLGLFSDIHDRLIQNKGLLRQEDAEFLAYYLIDRMVDDCYSVVDEFSTKVESIDKSIFANQAGDDVLKTIYRLKRDGMRLRKSIYPLREALSRLVRDDIWFRKEAKVFLRDAYDHAMQLIETLDGSRDLLLSMMDVYLSYQSNQLNKQMRLLTVITLIFMPLTLITGIYGMNFDHMPELHWPYGYYMVLGGMALMVTAMVVFLYRRHWLSPK